MFSVPRGGTRKGCTWCCCARSVSSWKWWIMLLAVMNNVRCNPGCGTFSIEHALAGMAPVCSVPEADFATGSLTISLWIFLPEGCTADKHKSARNFSPNVSLNVGVVVIEDDGACPSWKHTKPPFESSPVGRPFRFNPVAGPWLGCSPDAPENKHSKGIQVRRRIQRCSCRSF